MAAAGLGTMRNVATQPAQTVMRADGRSWRTQKIASHQVPRLPRQMPLDVAKCHACHAKRRPARTSASQEPPPPQVPLLPRKRRADLTKCHACHAKCPWLLPSATLAKRKTAASPATSADQARHKSQPSAKVPRLPRKRKVYLTKCHGFCAKDHGITGDQRGPSAPQEPASATPAMQTHGRSYQVPRLPRQMPLDVAKRHACQAKDRGVTGDQRGPSASQEPAQCQSATPAAQTQGLSHQVPRLLRERPRHHW